MNITTRQVSHFNPAALRHLQMHAVSSEAPREVSPQVGEDRVSLSPQALRALNGSSTASRTEVALGRGGDSAPMTDATRGLYANYGDHSIDITNREHARGLIVASPQVDDLRDTRHDDHRCGGAAIFNAMIMDGGYQANSRAIEASLPRGYFEGGRHGEVREALDSMRAGHLTPHQADRLQDLMYTETRRISHSRGSEGLYPSETGTMVRRLASFGAFPNSREVEIVHEGGSGEGHITSRVTTLDGRQGWADSAVSSESRLGSALAGNGAGPAPTSFTLGSEYDSRFRGMNVLSRDASGQLSARDITPDVRDADLFLSGGRFSPETVTEQTYSIGDGGRSEAMGSPLHLDADTGSMILGR